MRSLHLSTDPIHTVFVRVPLIAGLLLATLPLGQVEAQSAPASSALSINDVSVVEGNSGTRSVVFTVTLSPTSKSAVKVSYATSDGSALAGSDYVAASGSLTFKSGQATNQISILVNGDTAPEADETFAVNLSRPVNADLARAQGIGTVKNDDNQPPRVTTTSGALAYTENDGFRTVDAGLTLADADSANLVSATAAITSGFAQDQDRLGVATPATSITSTYNAATGVLTLSGLASLAVYQTILRSVTYANSSDRPTASTRVVTFTATDPAGGSGTATRSISITPVNDAPVLHADGSPTLPATDENLAPSSNTGMLVSALINSGNTSAQGGDYITDPDATAAEGLAVVGADSANGAWQFSTDNGTTWSTLGAVSEGAARLLASNASTRVRFLQNAGFNGSAALTVRAWDQTSGANGGTADASSNGGTTAISSTTDSASITVTGVNDPPVLTMTSGPLSSTEGDGPRPIDTGLRLSDPDSLQLGFAQAVIDSFDASQDTLGFVNVGSITGAYNAATGVLTLSGFDSVANYQTALRGVTYTNISDRPSATRVVNVSVADSSGRTAAASRTISITPVNDAPVLRVEGSPKLAAIDEDIAPASNTGTLVSTLIGSGDAAALGGDYIVDPDGAALEGLAVTAVDSTEGSWQFSTDNGATWSVLAAVSDTAARLLASNSSTRVRFVPNANFNGTAGLSFRAWDQTSGANGATANVSSNAGMTAFSAATDTATIAVNAPAP